MGEYLHEPTGEQVAKLGTCEHFMYVRRDELEAIRPHYRGESVAWALDTETETGGAIFRFPWPDEDQPLTDPAGIVDAINRRDPFPYYDRRDAEAKLPRELAPEIEAHGLAQVKPNNGRDRFNVYASVPCPVGMMTTSGSWPVYIVGERTSAPLGRRAVVECAWCRSLFSLTQTQVDQLAGVSDAVRERLVGIPAEVA